MIIKKRKRKKAKKTCVRWEYQDCIQAGKDPKILEDFTFTADRSALEVCLVATRAQEVMWLKRASGTIGNLNWKPILANQGPLWGEKMLVGMK